jgi:hypothetical protein
MVRHNQMGFLADSEKRVVQEVPSLFEPLDLLQKNLGIHHDAVSYDANFIGVKGPGGNQVQDRLYPVDDERMTGIVTALEAHHEVCVLGKEVDDFPFPLVSPLCSDNCDIHY